MAYTKIQHEERLRFGLSCNEYCVADSICNLSNNDKNSYGWCYMTRTNLGESLGLTKQAILNIIEKLVKAELVEIHAETKYLRPTALWYKNFTNGKENLPESNNSKVKKVYRNGKESLLNSGKESLLYIENITLKETIKILKEESEISKNEISTLSQKVIDFEKMIEEKDLEIQSLKDQEKKGKQKSSAKKESLVYEFPEDFSEEVIVKFMGFVENRKDIGKAVKTQRTVNELIEAITPFDNTDRLMAIRHSIGNGWTGLFPKKTNNSNLVYHNHDKNGTSSQLSNPRSKNNWNAEQVALDAIAIATAHLR